MSHEGSKLSTSSKSIILIELLTRRKWVSLKSLTLKDPKGELSKYDKKSVPGFIKLLGYCVRSEESDSTDLSEHGVTAVYEYGKRLF
jgi:hypothetical protein